MVDEVNPVRLEIGVVHKLHKRKFYGWSYNEIMQLSRSIGLAMMRDPIKKYKIHAIIGSITSKF